MEWETAQQMAKAIDAVLAQQASIPADLLQETLTTLRHARTFITSRERMHADGVKLYDELYAALSARRPAGEWDFVPIKGPAVDAVERRDPSILGDPLGHIDAPRPAPVSSGQRGNSDRWTQLPFDGRPYACATSDCERQAAWRFEAGGVASDFCSDCKAVIQRGSQEASEQ